MKINLIKKTKMNFFLILIFFIIGNICLISSASQSVEVDYSFSNNTFFEKTLSFSSVLLKIKTDKNAVCKYSSAKGVSYENMEGDFDPSLGKIHEKSLTNLEDGGIYKYYIKCVEDLNNITIEPYELEIMFKINTLVTADIILSKESPLKEGKVEVTLVTSKIISQKPSLSYSFDGTVYNKLFLTGSKDVWKGFLIIPDIGESILSFKFSAIDLEGRVGEIIKSGEFFIVDTKKPKTISNINAIGYEGKIKLEWYINEDVKEFNIYRSESPNPDYTNFYKTTDDNPFYDTLVEKGKTYYYRVAALDEAGNEGDLSKEVYATALVDNSSFSSSLGLALSLRGFVDNFLTEINSTFSEIDNIKNSISLRQEKEKNLFSDLKLEKEIDNKKSELNALKRDVENFKLQDLTKEELNKKLDSARLKLNIIRKKIPENLVIIGEDSKTEEVNKESIDESLLEIKPYLSEKEREKSIKETLKFIEESNLRIKSNFYLIEVVYLDGTKNDISMVKREIDSEFKESNLSFIEIIPKDIIESASELDIKTLNYEVVKEDPILSFSSDTEEIVYFFNKKSNLDLLKETKLVPVYAFEEEKEYNPITGYFLLVSEKKNYIGILVGLIILSSLFFYFLYLKKNKPSEYILRLSEKIENALDILKKGDLNKVKEIYNSIRIDYHNLEQKEKAELYESLEFLRNKILIFDLENGLKKLEKTKDRELLKKLEEIYNSLSEDFKQKISDYFKKIKADIENEN